jgi:hypothetical protein
LLDHVSRQNSFKKTDKGLAGRNSQAPVECTHSERGSDARLGLSCSGMIGVQAGYCNFCMGDRRPARVRYVAKERCCGHLALQGKAQEQNADADIRHRKQNLQNLLRNSSLESRDPNSSVAPSRLCAIKLSIPPTKKMSRLKISISYIEISIPCGSFKILS